MAFIPDPTPAQWAVIDARTGHKFSDADRGSDNEEKADNHIKDAMKSGSIGRKDLAMGHLQRAAALTSDAGKRQKIAGMAKKLGTVSLSNPSTGEREKLAKSGDALPDGSFPIKNVTFLKKAIKAVGRAGPGKRPALAALIRKEAKRLGAVNAPGVKGTWAFQGSNSMDLAGALPVTSASDGPRITTMAGTGKVTTAAAGKLGLNPMQTTAYAKLRKKGMPHSTALAFAKRVRSTPPGGAQNMSNALNLASTNQSSALLRQSTGRMSYGGANLSAGRGKASTRQTSALLNRSAGKVRLGGKGLGSKLVPHSAGSGGPGTSVQPVSFNTHISPPIPQTVKGIGAAYKKLRAAGYPHDIALNVARRAKISGRTSLAGTRSGRVVTKGPNTTASI